MQRSIPIGHRRQTTIRTGSGDAKLVEDTYHFIYTYQSYIYTYHIYHIMIYDLSYYDVYIRIMLYIYVLCYTYVSKLVEDICVHVQSL